MRLLSLALPLLAACASSPERVLVLESDGFMCGAEQGLGCGLAVAPALEQIDALAGVERSEVSWDGRVFRIELEPDADVARVSAEAWEVVRADPSCDLRALEPASAAANAPTRWIDASSTIELSLHEAQVLAASFAAGMRETVVLDEADARALQAAMQEELELAFRNAHAAGGGVHRLHEQLPASRARFERRIAEFLTPEQCAGIGAFLDAELGA